MLSLQRKKKSFFCTRLTVGDFEMGWASKPRLLCSYLGAPLLRHMDDGNGMHIVNVHSKRREMNLLFG